jgi:hypothetical protein
MTKKDYILIAEAINYSLESYLQTPIVDRSPRSAIEWVTVNIAHRLEGNNPRFDYEKFYLACGLDPMRATRIDQ